LHPADVLISLVDGPSENNNSGCTITDYLITTSRRRLGLQLRRNISNIVNYTLEQEKFTCPEIPL
jgi:hypothetical protein